MSSVVFGTQRLNIPQHSAAHYYSSEFVVLQVQSQLYHVPIDLLARQSHVFANLFSLPRTGVHQNEGYSDEAPIVLHGHSSADFDCLLDHIFGSILISATANILESVYAKDPEPYHTSALSGEAWVMELLSGHPERIRCELGVHAHVFAELISEIRALGHTASKFVSLEEQLVIFL
ncbi:uncharacterized protein HD556DRAFT_1438737 [Suillus plorans]|uniref:DUF8040 domain-containing protein n=1 Tax=Suillus plorans TaxID=116603 RepID=A0A9P7DQL8_9AGAM|nr:uncharacterized protein HD556DRAFT_1438737 [Suillus plorans]KAG1800737.1 hypothetical protein HD556DRAFT_1438737 [Suillus plorans]